MAVKRPNRVLGEPHDSFWRWCEQGELRLQRCTDCGEISWPAVGQCDACGSSALEWQAISGEGTVVSWCTFERDYYRGTFQLPWTNIVVELAEGPWFITEPGDFSRENITPGMPVRLAFRRCEDSTGDFNLPVFNKV